MIFEVDSDLLLQIIGVYTIALLMGIFFGWAIHQGRDMKKVITLLGSTGNRSPGKKDSGLAFLEAIAEKKIPDTATLEISFIKQWITAELNKSTTPP
jgi:hypothetical protein